MRWRGRVYTYITKTIERGEKLHFSLIDPDPWKRREVPLTEVVRVLAEAGTDAIMIGGSLNVSSEDVVEVVKIVEEYDRPSILFPGGPTGLAPNADAVLFISLLNSENPYFIVGAQALSAPLVKRLGLEVLPTAYLVVGHWDSSVCFVGQARPIPTEKPEIGAAFALAAKFMGMKLVYLEAGSGAPRPVPSNFVATVKKALENTPLIVGGGIRERDQALAVAEAGADIIVTGTVIEKDLRKATEIIAALKRR